MDVDDVFCREAACEIGVAQHGTATEVDAWFVLELDAPWAAKAWDKAAIPDAVRGHVDAWVRRTPGARIQLARRDQPSRRDQHAHATSCTLLLANTRQATATVARYGLASMDAVGAIDLDAAIADLRAGRVPPGATTIEKPVALVCTNGKRDRCCAKWGLPLFEALAADDRIETWQTTHLGGHRFAATMVWLPHGLCHGRVMPEDARRLVDAIVRGEVGPLELLRGRTALPEAAQAAEILCRRELGLSGRDDVVIGECTPGDGPDRWIVTGTALAEPVRFTVERHVGLAVAPPSCGKPAEPAEHWSFAPVP